MGAGSSVPPVRQPVAGDCQSGWAQQRGNMVMGRGALEGAMALGRSRERRPRALEGATLLGRFLIPPCPAAKGDQIRQRNCVDTQPRACLEWHCGSAVRPAEQPRSPRQAPARTPVGRQVRACVKSRRWAVGARGLPSGAFYLCHRRTSWSPSFPSSSSLNFFVGDVFFEGKGIGFFVRTVRGGL